MSKHRHEPRSQEPRTPPVGAWWNGIARAWFTGGAKGDPVRLDPQPAPPPPPSPVHLGGCGERCVFGCPAGPTFLPASRVEY